MSDTGPAKLPGLPTLRTDDRALAAWSQAVAEHLEVRNGARGNPAEKAVVQRDLDAISKRVDAVSGGVPVRGGAVSVDIGGGRSGSFQLDALVTELLANPRIMEALSAATTVSQADTPNAQPAGATTPLVTALESRVNELTVATELASATAREAQSAAVASGINRIFSKNLGVRHPGALKIDPDVVIFNDITVGEFMLDIYKRLYTAETKSKVSLDPGSIFYNGFTVEQWAQYVWGKIGTL